MCVNYVYLAHIPLLLEVTLVRSVFSALLVLSPLLLELQVSLCVRVVLLEHSHQYLERAQVLNAAFAQLAHFRLFLVRLPIGRVHIALKELILL